MVGKERYRVGRGGCSSRFEGNRFAAAPQKEKEKRE